MLDKTLVGEAIKMTHEGASDKDLYTCLFVSEDEFLSWFNYGKDLVVEGYGRDTADQLKDDEDIDSFDILCLLLYKGVVSARWKIKKHMHRLVSESENPLLCFKYLEAVYQIDKGHAPEEKDKGDESATSFVMEEFYNKNEQHKQKAEENAAEETDNQTEEE